MAAKTRKKATKKIPLLGQATEAEFQAAYNFTPAEIRRAERILAKVEGRRSEKRKAPAKAPAVARRRKAS